MGGVSPSAHTESRRPGDIIDRYRYALNSGSVPPDDRAIIKDALKLMLAICLFRREPVPGTLAMLQEYYVSVGHPLSPRHPGLGGRRVVMVDEPRFPASTTAIIRRDSAEEIELFCRILEVLREAAAMAEDDTA